MSQLWPGKENFSEFSGPPQDPLSDSPHECGLPLSLRDCAALLDLQWLVEVSDKGFYWVNTAQKFKTRQTKFREKKVPIMNRRVLFAEKGKDSTTRNSFAKKFGAMIFIGNSLKSSWRSLKFL